MNQNTQEGQSEFRDKLVDLSLIINMDAMPAWLVDESAETILAINNAFSRVTGFDLSDLDTLKPAALLAGTETKEQVALVTKTGEQRRGKSTHSC